MKQPENESHGVPWPLIVFFCILSVFFSVNRSYKCITEEFQKARRKAERELRREAEKTKEEITKERPDEAPETPENVANEKAKSDVRSEWEGIMNDKAPSDARANWENLKRLNILYSTTPRALNIGR
jgi:hypothetical protein